MYYKNQTLDHLRGRTKGADTRKAKHGAKHGAKHDAKREAKHEAKLETL